MRLSPFLRNLLILAAISLVVMALNLYVALATAAILLRVAFSIAVGVATLLAAALAVRAWMTAS